MKKKILPYLTLIFTFLLGHYNGFIALWQLPEPKPRVVFPYSTASLPRADQEKLADGILIESEEALQQLLEDYLS